MNIQFGSLQFVYFIRSPLASALEVANLPGVHAILVFLNMYIVPYTLSQTYTMDFSD